MGLPDCVVRKYSVGRKTGFVKVCEKVAKVVEKFVFGIHTFEKMKMKQNLQ
jgi:hypothetical protein